MLRRFWGLLSQPPPLWRPHGAMAPGLELCVSEARKNRSQTIALGERLEKGAK